MLVYSKIMIDKVSDILLLNQHSHNKSNEPILIPIIISSWIKSRFLIKNFKLDPITHCQIPIT